MTGKSHLFFGLCSGLTCGFIIGSNAPETVAGTLALTAVGSLFPDIDSPNSKIGRKIKPISWVVNKLFGHRGLVHTPLFAIGIFGVVLSLMLLFDKLEHSNLLTGFIVGYIGHLLLDTFTIEGIMWAYPFNKNKFHFANIKTGSFFEYLISIICLPIVCLVVLFLFV